MSHNNHVNVSCAVCGKKGSRHDMYPAELVREGIAETIRKYHGEWDPKGFICLNDLNQYRARHIEDVFKEEAGEVSSIEMAVIKSLKENETLSADVDQEFIGNLSFGEKVADLMASFGGSWKFIIFFGSVLLCWIGINSAFLIHEPFDPYPYILLNLVLSCLAAIQAPVIMMSQNRVEAKDRLRGEHDYRVNLKAELEIRHLHEKIDHLLIRQWQRLAEIQQTQLEMLEQLTGSSKKE